MKLRKLGNNETELTLANGVTVLFSYETPVAAFVPGHGFYRAARHYSNTTSRHITQWLEANGVPRKERDTVRAEEPEFFASLIQ